MNDALAELDGRFQETRCRHILIGLTVALLIVRLWLDHHLELMFDEAYYALWSKHWAWGYLDHPPLIALWISLSTWLFGEGQFGVCALSTITAAAGSGFVYILSNYLFANRPAAAFAGLLYCATLLIGAGAIVITPETPLVFFWSIAVYALARIYRDGEAELWWLVGTAMGLALQSKYTALLLGAGIPCALLVVPKMRVWWRRPQPYLAALLAFAIFSPVVVWNYQHGWASFQKQFGRAAVPGLTLRYIAEFIAIQIGLLTPLVSVIAGAGIWLAFVRRRRADAEPETLLLSLIAPMGIYFLFHSLHARVQGNWTAPAYPILAILGAQAAFRLEAHGPHLQQMIAFCQRWAVPLGLALVSIVYAQAATAFIPLNPAIAPSHPLIFQCHLCVIQLLLHQLICKRVYLSILCRKFPRHRRTPR